MWPHLKGGRLRAPGYLHARRDPDQAARILPAHKAGNDAPLRHPAARPTPRIVLSVNELTLYEASGSAESRPVPPSTIRATLATSTGGTGVQNVAACFDGNATTACTTGAADPEPSLQAGFYCIASGTALGTLSSVVVQMAPETNASEFELVLKNKAGSTERVIPFPEQDQDRSFTFQLDASVAQGVRARGRLCMALRRAAGEAGAGAMHPGAVCRKGSLVPRA